MSYTPNCQWSLTNFADISSTLPRIITRAEWESEDRLEPPINLNLPVPFIVISHTGGDSCQSETECSSRVRTIQIRDFVKNGFSDIGFNFLIGGDGNAYEGRGWNYVGAHTWSYNTRSIGISLIGNFSTDLPSDRQLRATQQLIELGVRKGKVARDYKLIGHCQNSASKTTSPGEAAYNIIKTWPHWVEVSVPNRALWIWKWNSVSGFMMSDLHLYPRNKRDPFSHSPCAWPWTLILSSPPTGSLILRHSWRWLSRRT